MPRGHVLVEVAAREISDVFDRMQGWMWCLHQGLAWLQKRSAPNCHASARQRRESSLRREFVESIRSLQRRISATLHACAIQPRGLNGGSASKISLIVPAPSSER